MKKVANIEINLDSVQDGLRLWIDARRPDTLFDAEENASDHNEARYQLVEGCLYDFQISDPQYVLGDVGENIVQPHKRTPNLGTIAPNIFVGTLSIPLLEKETLQECTKIDLEVQSVKSGYRDDYRDMLELITEKCTDLLLRANSPVSQHFEIDYTRDGQSLYQKFAFIKSVIGTEEFSEAVHRIVTAPVTKWTETTEEKDIRNARRFSNANIKEILKGSKRTRLPDSHYLKSYGIETLPERISTIRKSDSVDTPENRFIKHALEKFLKFCTDMNNKAREYGHKKMENESEIMIRELESQLHHTVFKDISRPTTLKLNSPVLQRKEGYREVLRVWLMFDLAAKLIWKGGDDIYSGGKKDIATLYEYWLFFKLLDLFQSIFEIEPKDISDLIEATPDGLNLQIKQGKFTALCGVYDSGSRKLNVRFNYNRSFSGKQTYPESGSWTTTLRPDYTLSFWPHGISETEAEKQELIVHVHFDAKYKIANLADFLEQNNENDLDEEKAENRKGIYKNADLLKMHAYKDAIRRTGGAYVLYPGDKAINQKGFHEIIPGLGAFPVKPSRTDSGIGELKAFILEIIEHFINRASQREKIAYRTFDVYKNPPKSDNVVKEPLPEPYDNNRDLIPDDTFVLVGFYKSEAHLNWIKEKKLYNFRMDNARGALVLTKESLSSKYLLLHTSEDKSSGELWKIIGEGFRVISQEALKKLNYPSPSQRNYMIVKIEKVTDPEFKDVTWDFKNLSNFSTGRASAFPFTTSLTELMKNKIR
ncbi:MAG: DUF2357 domain-containing protein [Saprospiraceae bacterium]|nr:DUF2357 domain-containing protein [Saprospiraceae bacterium]MBX7179729.1 DUF2357 domain-containing protein [Saprospiraceae bacterium]MCB0589799.1 DUF2357 domain-containing protein [Saprospiraceae bacterium]MCO5282122.1 DUF2357 domain-containing protein [Saprospiraceae bacterium]HMY83577.1 DUF2357 domain-containing protein [Saprospiraceae bacterium]